MDVTREGGEWMECTNGWMHDRSGGQNAIANRALRDGQSNGHKRHAHT